ncbi:MAG: ISKra4 family transposase [Armatimonadota bacterium]
MFDVEKSIAQARDGFNALVAYVLGEGQSHEAYAVEVRVFRQVLAMGLHVLAAYFDRKKGGDVGQGIETEGGEVLGRERLKFRRYVTVFGELGLWRTYYHEDGSPGVFPLDEETNLPESTYSYFVQELVEQRVGRMTYDEVVAEVETLFGFRLPKHTVEDLAPRIAADADAYYEAQGTPAPETEAEVLVAAIDGKGVPMVKGEPAEHRVRLGRGEKRSRKKEAVVTAVYTIEPHPRTAADVVREIRDHQRPPQRPTPQNKRLRATLQGKQNAMAWVRADVERRDPDHRKPRVCLMDGSKGLWTAALAVLAGLGFTFILDLFHVLEYLWKAAYVFHPEGSPEAEAFVRDRLRMLLDGKVGYVIGGLRQRLTKHRHTLTKRQRETLATVIHYYEANRKWMRYHEYIAAGYPIGSGAVEGACRHLVKDRMEGSGMRWTVGGAAAVLNLRGVYLNGNWDPFWHFHMQREGQRRFGGRRWTPSSPSEDAKVAA